MKYQIVLMAAGLCCGSFAYGAANCQHSHSWQCQGHHSNSGQNSQTGGGINSGGRTPDPAQTNPHLGSTQPPAQLPLKVHKAPVLTPQAMPVLVSPQQPIATPPQQPIATPPVQVNPIIAPPLTGVGKVPSPQPIVAPPVQVNPIIAPPLTGVGKVPSPQPIVAPPVQVLMVPGQVVTGQAMVPPKPTIKVPLLAPVLTPPQQPYLVPSPVGGGQVPNLVPQIVNVSPQAKPAIPPRQVYPNPQPIVVGFGPVPQPSQVPQPVPGQVPQPVPGQVPQPVPGQVPSQVQQVTQSPGQIPMPTGTSGATHLVVNNHVAQVPVVQPLTDPDQGRGGASSAILDKRVELYKSNEAAQLAYREALPADRTGFHLTVVGIREPVFTQPVKQLPVAEKDTFVFFFDYASAAVHPSQSGVYDEIVAEYNTTGKHLIVMGETDGFGTAAYNHALAVHRSAMIVDELKQRGIPEDAIELRILARCCREDPSSDEQHLASQAERITWVHFE